LALKKELPQMLGEYFKLQPDEAKAFVDLANTLETTPTPSPSPNDSNTPTPRPTPSAKEEEPEEEKTVFAAVFSDDGTLLDVLEGVGVPAKMVSKACISLSEMLSADLVPEIREKLEDNHFIKNIQEDISESRINTNTPRPIPGGGEK
jgi:hypothetical protein